MKRKKSLILGPLGIITMLLTTSCQMNSKLFAYSADEANSKSPLMTSLAPTPAMVDENEAINAPLNSPQKDRQIIFTASIYLLVENISETMDKIIEKARREKGYMQSMDSKSVVLRIPASRFQDFLNQIEQLGKTTDKNIVGQDVTEKMLDLNIRLDNAEKLRKRYSQLLAKGDKVEDMLKIEKALGEVTEKIERMKGQIRFMNNKISFSTISVNLNSSIPQKDIHTEIPIRWVKQLGSNIANTNKYRLSYYSSYDVVDFDLPTSFMKLSGNSYRTTAMSPEGIYIDITEESNLEGGTLDFWKKIIEKSLEKKSALLIKSNKELKLDTGWPARIITAEKVIRNEKYSYMIAVTVYKDTLYLYEVWGPEKVFKEKEESIKQSVKSMEIGTFMQILFSPSLW